MRHTLYSYLAGHEKKIGTAELLDCVFAGEGADSDFGREFLRSLLADDPRFIEEPVGAWSIVEDNLFAAPVDEAPFVIVDLETTGQRADREGITEIGAIRIEGGREVGRFEQLVNPGRSIPPFVSKLTGISDAMVADAPRIAEVIGPFIEFAEGAVLVAHNAAFDVALLDHQSRSVLERPLGMPSLCTVKLAQRLLPELRKTSLDSLSDHFDLEVGARHRAIGDAETTAAILERLVAMLSGQGACTVIDLMAAQDDPESPRRLEINVAQNKLEDLPVVGGVYRLIGAQGESLFVGRARDLRDRVQRHFLGADHASDRQLAMLSNVYDIEHTVTGCELEAALVEAREIRRHEPAYNRSGKHLPRNYFVRMSGRGDLPRLLVATRIKPDGSLYVGPLKGRAFAEDAAELLAASFRLRTCAGPLSPDPSFKECRLAALGWCSRPCNGSVDAGSYQAQVKDFECFLRDGNSDLGELVERLGVPRGSSVSRRFQAAARRLARLRRRMPWLVNNYSYFAVAPGAEAGLFVMAVVGGLCLGPVDLREAGDIDSVVKRILSANKKTGPRRVSSHDTDASTILNDWFHSPERGGRETSIGFDSADRASLDDAVATLRGMLSRVSE